MKKLVLLFAALFLITSCSMDDNTPTFHVEFIPVESVEVPDYFAAGNTYQIKVRYKRPTDCHFYDGFYYEESGGALIVAVQTLVIEDAKCEPLENMQPEESIFEFTCSPMTADVSAYLFKFYKGEDDAGNPIYMDIEVPVAQ